MLNHKSIPVWMLADILLVLLISGSLLGSVIMQVMLPSWVSPRELKNLRLTEHQVLQQRQQLLQQQHEATEWKGRYRQTQALVATTANRMQQLRDRYETLALQKEREKLVRQKLLGLRGSLKHPVFVIDISGSMNKVADEPMDRPNWGSDGKPWTFVCNQVTTWLELLPVESFRVICFDQRIIEFPAVEDGWATGPDARNDVREFLAGTTPKGLTLLENAILRAVEWKPTCIILFTDGAQSNEAGKFDPQQVERLLQRDLPPINVVAVNDYFDKKSGSLLHRLAARSHGSFIGL